MKGPRQEPLRVLVVDDEESMRWFVRAGLVRSGFAVDVAGDADAALRLCAEHAYAAAVLDVRLPGRSGIELLGLLRARRPDLLVVIITAFGSIAAAVDAIKRGAFDYLTKPFEITELVGVLERGLRAAATTSGSATKDSAPTDGPTMVADSPAMVQLLGQIETLRDSDSGVLITGESGTGKELVARTLHARSRRAAGPFVAVNCAALPEALIASELFGHEVGAFTGAVRARTGLIARADGGTLFLDEIAELRLESQVKLERFLQEREVVPLGSDTPRRVDVRGCAATSRVLRAAVDLGLFRPELYFRLAVVPLAVPPLRARPEDVPGLVAATLQRARGRGGRHADGFSLEAMAALQAYAWPGNVRELQNLVERVAILCQSDTIEFADLPAELRTAGKERLTGEYGGVVEYGHALAAFERQYLGGVLHRVQGNMSEAARIAGISRGHLHRKVKQLGLAPADYRGGESGGRG